MLVPNTHPTPRTHKARGRHAVAPVALTAAALIALAATSQLHVVSAAPQGGTISSGSGTISSSGGQTVIDTTSQRTIIDFTSFDLGANDSVTFNQPNADAAVLNRISGSGESFINGTLLSNGQVFIVNPAGVTFGNNAVINVGRLVAAASTINGDDFLAGIERFTSSAGTGNIQNFSNAIQGNDGVVFVGRVVDNAGTIQSNGGTIALVAGSDVLLSEGPEGQIFARIEGFNDPESRGPVFTDVINTGVIDNPTGQVLIGAGDLFALSVLRQGRINTQALTLDTGAAALVLSEESSQFSTISENATITINTAQLQYFAGVAPNDRIWVNAPQGFVNLSPDPDPNDVPASLNGVPTGGPVDSDITSTFIDRHALQLPIDRVALSGFDRITPDAGQRQALAELFGLETTGFEDRPLADALSATSVLNDLSADPNSITISSERLSYDTTQDALAAYDRVFPMPADDAGQAAADGEDVLAAEIDQTQRVRSLLQEAADRHMADQEVTEIDPEAFAQWLTENDPDALDALSGLDDLVNSTMPNLGLGTSEMDSFKQWTYGKIAPRGVSLRTLDQLVAASARPI